MEYLFLLGAVCCSGALSITANIFNKKNVSGADFSSLYSLIVTTSSFLMWALVFAFDFSFNPHVLPYSVCFGVFYVLAFVGLYYAMRDGSASLTAFVKQLSLIIVALWGFVFWDNPISNTVVTGLILVFLSLWLCFKPSKEGRTSIKWCLFSLLVIVGNAGCSVVQKYQQIDFGGSHGSLLMLGSTFVAALLSAFMYFTRNKGIKKSDMPCTAFLLPVIAGVASTALNIFVLNLISSSMLESVFFPVIGVGGIVLTTVFSVGVYKEKLSASRKIGLVIGLLAIVFLNMQ